DLPMHRRRAIAEFCRPDREVIIAVLCKPQTRFRAMLSGGHRAMHREGNAFTFQPVAAGGPLHAVAPGQSTLYQVEALVESVAAKLSVGGGGALSHHLVSRAHHVAAAECDRIDMQ